MTPKTNEERARAWLDGENPWQQDDRRFGLSSLTALLDAVQAEEREAAAKRVRDLWESLDGWCPCRYSDGLGRVVDAIRSRGKP